MDDSLTAKVLAKNIALLRQARGINQNQLAALSGIPRSTITHIESGAGNPSLSNLVKLSEAFEVQVQELLTPPLVTARLYKSDDMTVKEKTGCVITDILPFGAKGCGVEKFEMPPGRGFVGVPHQRGTREFFSVLQGKIQVMVQDDVFLLSKGDVLVFAGEEKHAYKNEFKTTAIGLSVLIA